VGIVYDAGVRGDEVKRVERREKRERRIAPQRTQRRGVRREE
jgi:hypothetical protein